MYSPKNFGTFNVDVSEFCYKITIVRIPMIAQTYLMTKHEKFFLLCNHNFIPINEVDKIFLFCKATTVSCIFINETEECLSSITSLKQAFHTAQIPLLFLSHTHNKKKIDQAIDLGIDDFIFMPCPKEILLSRIKLNIKRLLRDLDKNPLTNLPGNRAIAQAINHQRSSVLIYVDINNFKHYNDTYGFEKGDEAINKTASLLIQTLFAHGNKNDFLGHIGGDDFLLITSPDKAATLRNAIEKAFKSEFEALTISTAIFEKTAETMQKIPPLLAKAMRYEKALNRNIQE